MKWKDRIQKNPRLLRLKNPSTGEIIDYEIQDLDSSEIIQEGTPLNAENLQEITVAVSPTEPTTNEKVWIQKGKNLLRLKETSQTLNGVTMTINSDGSITLNGTATADTSLVFSKQVIKDIGDYAFGITTDFSSIGYSFEVCGYVYGKDGNYKYNISTNNSPTRKLAEGEYISNFNIFFLSGAKFNNFIIYPQLERGTEATENEPYIDRKINVDSVEFLNVERIIENYFVQTYDSKFDDVSQIIGDGFQENKVYIITNEPLSDDNYIQSGSTHTIIGSERLNQKYGYQLSLSYGGIKFRTKFDNVWGSWQTII